jgi:hypothetical protein
MTVGAWRSLVAHTLGVRVVAGSNPAAPTNNLDKNAAHKETWPRVRLRSQAAKVAGPKTDQTNNSCC